MQVITNLVKRSIIITEQFNMMTTRTKFLPP